MDISLVSGGLDSTLGYALFAQNTTPVYINYNGKYNEQELAACKKIYGKSLIVLEIRNTMLSDESFFVPSRNLTFCSLCVSFLKDVNSIFIFGVADDVCVDKNNDAYQKMTEIISLFSNKPVCVSSPCQDITKVQLIEKAMRSLSNFKYLIDSIFSCYTPNPDQCFDCPACLRREMALFDFNIHNSKKLSRRVLEEYIQRADLEIKRHNNIKKYKNCIS